MRVRLVRISEHINYACMSAAGRGEGAFEGLLQGSWGWVGGFRIERGDMEAYAISSDLCIAEECFENSTKGNTIQQMSKTRNNKGE